jgi:hypothetical protein
MYDINGEPLDFRAGRAGELPYAPDIPSAYNPNAPTSAPEMSLRDRIERALFMGGATDVRNMMQGAAPAGLSMALSRMANPTAQVAQRVGADAAEQMFDFSRPAPVMSAAGGMLLPGLAAAGQGGGQLQFSEELRARVQQMEREQAAARAAREEAMQRGSAERVNMGLQNWIPQQPPTPKSWWEFWR